MKKNIFLTRIFLPPLPTILFFELVLRRAKRQGRLVGFMPLLMLNLVQRYNFFLKMARNPTFLFYFCQEKVGFRVYFHSQTG